MNECIPWEGSDPAPHGGYIDDYHMWGSLQCRERANIGNCIINGKNARKEVSRVCNKE